MSKFEMGQVVMTNGICEQIIEDEAFGKFVHDSLSRHRECDWGDMADEDLKMNDEAMENGDRIFSAYKPRQGKKIWIITEADRSATTILFPDEY